VSHLVAIFERLEAIEKKLDELIAIKRRGAGDYGRAAVAPRRKPDGTWERWGGEGTGWIPCDPPRDGDRLPREEVRR
jgi:hypothetical protein